MLARRTGPQPPVLMRMAFFSCLFIMLFYVVLDLDLGESHYWMPIWWVFMFLGAAAISQSRGRLRGLLTAAAALTIMMNAAYVFAAHAWIVKCHGTRGDHYSPDLTELRNAIHEICVDSKAKHPGGGGLLGIDGSAIIGLCSPAVEYHFAHDPACRGARLVSEVPKGSRVARYEVIYRDSDQFSAALGWTRTD